MAIIPSSVVVEFTHKDTAAAVKYKCRECKQEFTLFRPLSTKSQLREETIDMAIACMVKNCEFRHSVTDPDKFTRLTDALWDIFENVEMQAKKLSPVKRRGFFEGHDVTVIALTGLAHDLQEMYELTGHAYGVRLAHNSLEKTVAKIMKEDAHPESPRYAHQVMITLLNRYIELLNHLYRRMHNVEPDSGISLGSHARGCDNRLSDGLVSHDSKGEGLLAARGQESGGSDSTDSLGIE
ncbi:hypothetical protein HC928_00505 [bacterium]|nr:hypothetical protein [bacterium]